MEIVPNIKKKEATNYRIKLKPSFIIYIFCLVFAPPLIPNLNLLLIITGFSLYKLIFRYKIKTKDVFYKSNMHIFSILLLLVTMYIFFVMGINIIINNVYYFENFAVTVYRLVFLIPAQLICIQYLICRSEELGFSLKEFLLTFIWAGIIQAIIGILALLFPALKELLINIMSNNIGSEVFFRGGGDRFRYFGFAASLLDTFGYGMGILFTLSIFLAFEKNSKYLYLSLILLIPSFLNSRTGLLISAMGFIWSIPLLFNKIRLLKLLKTILRIILLITIGIIGLKILEIVSPLTIEWITRGLMSFSSIFTGHETEYIEVTDILFSDRFWTLPEGLELIFGTGHTAYGISDLGFHSDVGYVNHIWLGGIIGTILLYIPLIVLFIKAHKKANRMGQWLVLYLFIAFFVGLIKGDLISYNAGLVTTLAIYFYVIYIEPS